MSLELGLILSFAIIALGGAGLAGVMLWLRKRDSDTCHHSNDGLKHA